jgi:two-component system, chemotaxis family, CheB/CheR fusion protein
MPGKKILRSKKALVRAKSGQNRRAPKANELSFCIAGIGASAGGLEAFEQFFSAMPPDSNVGFVLVPHLDPTHTSMLPELLQRLTKMTVVQARHGIKVAPNQIYVVPPNKDIEILRGTLCLSDPATRQALRLPIDLFFRSLAADQGQKAVGIILSGSGSDGTLGLGAIKAEYGMTIVQDPNSAKFRGMPTSAIDAGIADFVLPPAKMPAQLLAYTAHSTRKVVGAAPNWVERTGNALSPIFLLLRSQTGHDFSYYKRNTISRRIERRMNVHQIRDVAQYTRYLKQNPQEVEMLFKELLIGVTSFFRDPEAFELLRSRIVTDILRNKSTDSALRFWVPGCSTGEEVYSLAIILREAMDEAQVNPRIQIFGTDIDSEAIDTARNGRYPANVAAGLSPERIKRFFVREGNTVRIRKEIREMALFAVQNVIKDPPFTRLDLICCRNLLIYLDGDLQKRLVPLFHYILNPGGLLLLGSSETIGRYGDLFSLVDKKWKLFRRKDSGSTDQTWEFDTARSLVADGGVRTDVDIRVGRQISVAEVAERALLDKYAPPCVIVNHKGDILYTHGRTGKFLELASGSAGLNVYEMAREGLRLELNSAVRRCSQQKKAVTLEGLRVKTNGGYQPITLTVRPLRERDDRLGSLTLVAFHELASQKAPKARKVAHPGKTSLKRIAELEQELRFAQESLQTSIEEMETSNEELKSMNEELQSTNEELQSTNEELETSKEEMQSLNEELVTVNSELQGKVDQLSELNNDMKNLLDSTHIATVFLDMKLRIKRFTPDATRIVNLIPSDIDRPLSHIASNLKREDLAHDAQTVLEKLIPKEVVVKTPDLRTFLMRMMPYRTVDNHIDGVVMTFTDIGAEHLLEAARDFAQGIVETVRQPLVVLDAQMRVLQANHAFYQTFAVDPKNTEQSIFFDLGNGQWNIPQLRALLWKILSENSRVQDFEVKHNFPGIGKRTMLVSARRIFHLGVGTDTVLLAIEDVSQARTHARDKTQKAKL